tara:strand:+ start:1030 stop:1554 length:525 start_codon:yes stop_codon:yes gene_type:complete
MKKDTNKNNTKEKILYKNILLLSRNKLLYTKFHLSDTFQNRIHLIFIHISFLFIKLNSNTKNKIYKDFYQKVFDLVFKQIELNMREIGYGDVVVNKNMKFLIKLFYSILLYCENYQKKTSISKKAFFVKHLQSNDAKKAANEENIIDYFDKFQAFCFDLSSDSVLKGELNFNYY